jgi:hypothetical protein
LDDEGEKFGMERVLEAIGSHQWETLEMKAQIGQTRRGRRHNFLSQRIEKPLSLFSGLEVVDQPKAAPPEDVNPITGDVDDQMSAFAPGLSFLDELRSDAFDLEKALMQMQDLKSRASGLPDAERRAFAASVALKFAMLLGDDDDEEGDEGYQEF